MSSVVKALLRRGAAAGLLALAVQAMPTASMAEERPLFITLGETTRAPIGWIEFCVEYDPECKTKPSQPRDVMLTTSAWKTLDRVNLWVNTHIKPMTDMDHWGVVERWNYPDDGYGDCEDYVLLKRRMLMQAGWPREALLVTVVRDKRGDGHAVLTVKTDKGEFVLDNQNDQILLWSDTGYRFVKRQSQTDQNVWVSLGEPRGTPATATWYFPRAPSPAPWRYTRKIVADMGGIALHRREQRLLPPRQPLVAIARDDSLVPDVIGHVRQVNATTASMGRLEQGRHVGPLHESVSGHGAPETRRTLGRLGARRRRSTAPPR